jgi:hypothetical protein
VKNLAHEIVSDLMRVKMELGRCPTRDEYHGGLGRFPKSTVKETFGNWTVLMQAAGLQYAKGKRDKQEARRLTFEKIRLDAAQARPNPPPIVRRGLLIGDLHVPYQHPDAIPFLLALHEKYNFDWIGSVGDEIDGHALSFHDHDPDLLSPGHELEAAIKVMEPLYKAFPKVHLAESNHGSMVFRKGKHHGLPRHVLKSYREILCAPEGWTWDFELRIQFPTGRKTSIHHAYSSNVLLASQRRATSLIQGHVHTKMGVQYWGNYDEVFFAAQTGCLIDDKQLAYAYNKNQVERPMLGSLGLFDGIPREFPMLIDASGRWTGFVP